MAEFRRTVLITGATRGIGRALALELSRLGCKLLLCGRCRGDLESLTNELTNPDSHVLRVLDVIENEEVLKWKEELLREEIIPDLLVNNAAVVTTGTFWTIPKDEFDKVISVNIIGVANVMRAFLPSMIERKKGIIVNMSSGWGRSTSPGVSAYCASKWGIEGLTKSVAQELPDPLAAIPVNPGVINTDMLQTAFGPSASSYMKPHKWSETAAPFLLNLTRSSNGTSVTIPKC